MLLRGTWLPLGSGWSRAAGDTAGFMVTRVCQVMLRVPLALPAPPAAAQHPGPSPDPMFGKFRFCSLCSHVPTH